MRRVFVGGVVLVACLSLAGAEALVIAERGKESDYAIVMPANPSPSHHYAAVEFRNFIAAATGEKLSVITHAAAMPQKAVVIVDADVGGDGDGFRLKVEGGRLYITGGCRGALYGVYEVLERFVGCRWYSSWRTVVPRRDRIEVPADLDELLIVDMGCVGSGLQCTERQVSICVKDSGGPYDYGVTDALVKAAQKEGASYALDVYPFYGSDVEAALRAGYDIRHGLIGSGVYASHGYERSHIDGVYNTLKTIKGYLGI